MVYGIRYGRKITQRFNPGWINFSFWLDLALLRLWILKGSGTFTGYVTAQSKDQAPKHYELFLCELPYYCIFCSMISGKIFSFLNYCYSSRDDGLCNVHIECGEGLNYVKSFYGGILEHPCFA